MPNDKHLLLGNELCEGSRESAVVVDQILKEKRIQSSQTGKRPGAYRKVLTDVVNSSDPAEAED